MASGRTLEIKLAEHGPHWMQEACAPHIVTAAIKELFRFGDIRVVAGPDFPEPYHCPCNLFTLASLSDADIATALERRISLQTLYDQHARRAAGTEDTIGRAGETAVRTAVERSNRFIIGHAWGDVKDQRIVGASDGLIYDPRLPVNQAGILVEIKNWRRWIYHDTQELWKHIRNAYAMDTVPLFFARRISKHTFDYVFKRVGGLGVEMRTQFAPPDLEDILASARDADGLDYFDLRFTTDPGPRFCQRVSKLASNVESARRRMDLALPIVEPFLDRLADEGVRGNARATVYWGLQAALNAANIDPLSLNLGAPLNLE